MIPSFPPYVNLFLCANGPSCSLQLRVGQYARRCGVDLAAHDVRRTFARLAHEGEAGLDQIQLSLGHASVKTTV